MNALQQSLLRLAELSHAGIISPQEAAALRQRLIEDYVGFLPAGGSLPETLPAWGATPGSSASASMSSGTPGRAGGGAASDDPSLLSSPVIATVKVQPVPQGTTAAVLQEVFAPFGEVHSAAVNVGHPNYGYVRFVDPLSAQLAARQATIQIGTTQCKVRLSRWRA
eukprot:RCo037535